MPQREVTVSLQTRSLEVLIYRGGAPEGRAEEQLSIARI